MKPDIPEDLVEMAAELESFKENLSDDALNLFQMYETYRKDVEQGKSATQLSTGLCILI